MMTPSSYSACLRYWSVTPSGNRWCSPRSTSLTSHDSSVSPVRDGRAGHEVLPLGEADVHPLGDQQGVVAGLRELRVPLRAHLGRRLEVEVLRVELEPVRVGQRLAGLHAQQHLVRLRVVRVGVVQVVRGQAGQAQLLLEPEEVFLHLLLDADAVVHQLAEEVVAAEDVAVVARGLAGVGVAVPLQQPLDLARRAAGGGDDPLAVGLEQLAVHAGLVVVALQRRERREPEEVVHPLGVLGQQRHVGVHLTRVVVADRLPAEGGALALVPGARREVALHADDRLDAVRLGLAPELVGAEDVAVVGHRQRRHPHPGRLGEQGVQPRRTVEHRELGVGVQVDETVAGTGGARHGVVCSVLALCRVGSGARGDRV